MRIFRRLLRFLGIIKPKLLTGKKARILINGREVAFWKGEDVKFELHAKPIEVLGRLDVCEVFPEVTAERIIKSPELDEYITKEFKNEKS